MTPPTSSIPRIFVSHSHADNAYCREFVRSLRETLGGEDDAVWYDEHNLGWGALRSVIDRELQARQHFVAILSPAACASEWVNAEIDAALYLLGKGTLRTLLFVTAERCDVSPLLRRYKRIERPDGSGFTAADAAARVVPIVRPPAQSSSGSLPSSSPAITASSSPPSPPPAPAT